MKGAKVLPATLERLGGNDVTWIRRGDIKECPVYKPTLEEFQDPLAYIRKIEPIASKYGICKIIPPVTASVEAGQVLKKANYKFKTRVQQLRLANWDSEDQMTFMTNTKSWDVVEFQKFANKFFLRQFNVSGNVNPQKVEEQFWQELASDSSKCVEYGSDLEGSGFSSSEDDPLGTSNWNLKKLPRLAQSMLRLLPDDIPGVTDPMLYIGMLYTMFAWHVEDHYLYSMNYHHIGAPKTWYGVPGGDAAKFEHVVKEHVYDKSLVGGDNGAETSYRTLIGKTTMFSPKVLVDNGIHCYRAVQGPGEFVMTFPRAYHAGFSQGYNCGEAVNFAMPSWLPYAASAARRYQLLRRLPVLPTEELLCKEALCVGGKVGEGVSHCEATDSDRSLVVDQQRGWIPIPCAGCSFPVYGKFCSDCGLPRPCGSQGMPTYLPPWPSLSTNQQPVGPSSTALVLAKASEGVGSMYCGIYATARHEEFSLHVKVSFLRLWRWQQRVIDKMVERGARTTTACKGGLGDVYESAKCCLCYNLCYLSHVTCGCWKKPICLNHVTQNNLCRCGARRVITLRTDAAQLKSAADGFEEDPGVVRALDSLGFHDIRDEAMDMSGLEECHSLEKDREQRSMALTLYDNGAAGDAVVSRHHVGSQTGLSAIGEAQALSERVHRLEGKDSVAKEGLACTQVTERGVTCTQVAERGVSLTTCKRDGARVDVGVEIVVACESPAKFDAPLEAAHRSVVKRVPPEVVPLRAVSLCDGLPRGRGRRQNRPAAIETKDAVPVQAKGSTEIQVRDPSAVPKGGILFALPAFAGKPKLAGPMPVKSKLLQPISAEPKLPEPTVPAPSISAGLKLLETILAQPKLPPPTPAKPMFPEPNVTAALPELVPAKLKRMESIIAKPKLSESSSGRCEVKHGEKSQWILTLASGSGRVEHEEEEGSVTEEGRLLSARKLEESREERLKKRRTLRGWEVEDGKDVGGPGGQSERSAPQVINLTEPDLPPGSAVPAPAPAPAPFGLRLSNRRRIPKRDDNNGTDVVEKWGGEKKGRSCRKRTQMSETESVLEKGTVETEQMAEGLGKRRRTARMEDLSHSHLAQVAADTAKRAGSPKSPAAEGPGIQSIPREEAGSAAGPLGMSSITLLSNAGARLVPILGKRQTACKHKRLDQLSDQKVGRRKVASVKSASLENLIARSSETLLVEMPTQKSGKRVQDCAQGEQGSSGFGREAALPAPSVSDSEVMELLEWNERESAARLLETESTGGAMRLQEISQLSEVEAEYENCKLAARMSRVDEGMSADDVWEEVREPVQHVGLVGGCQDTELGDKGLNSPGGLVGKENDGASSTPWPFKNDRAIPESCRIGDVEGDTVGFEGSILPEVWLGRWDEREACEFDSTVDLDDGELDSEEDARVQAILQNVWSDQREECGVVSSSAGAKQDAPACQEEPSCLDPGGEEHLWNVGAGAGGTMSNVDVLDCNVVEGDTHGHQDVEGRDALVPEGSNALGGVEVYATMQREGPLEQSSRPGELLDEHVDFAFARDGGALAGNGKESIMSAMMGQDPYESMPGASWEGTPEGDVARLGGLQRGGGTEESVPAGWGRSTSSLPTERANPGALNHLMGVLMEANRLGLGPEGQAKLALDAVGGDEARLWRAVGEKGGLQRTVQPVSDSDGVNQMPGTKGCGGMNAHQHMRVSSVLSEWGTGTPCEPLLSVEAPNSKHFGAGFAGQRGVWHGPASSVGPGSLRSSGDVSQPPASAMPVAENSMDCEREKEGAQVVVLSLENGSGLFCEGGSERPEYRLMEREKLGSIPQGQVEAYRMEGVVGCVTGDKGKGNASALQPTEEEKRLLKNEKSREKRKLAKTRKLLEEEERQALQASARGASRAASASKRAAKKQKLNEQKTGITNHGLGLEKDAQAGPQNKVSPVVPDGQTLNREGGAKWTSGVWETFPCSVEQRHDSFAGHGAPLVWNSSPFALDTAGLSRNPVGVKAPFDPRLQPFLQSTSERTSVSASLGQAIPASARQGAVGAAVGGDRLPPSLGLKKPELRGTSRLSDAQFRQMERLIAMPVLDGLGMSYIQHAYGGGTGASPTASQMDTKAFYSILQQANATSKRVVEQHSRMLAQQQSAAVEGQDGAAKRKVQEHGGASGSRNSAFGRWGGGAGSSGPAELGAHAQTGRMKGGAAGSDMPVAEAMDKVRRPQLNNQPPRPSLSAINSDLGAGLLPGASDARWPWSEGNVAFVPPPTGPWTRGTGIDPAGFGGAGLQSVMKSCIPSQVLAIPQPRRAAWSPRNSPTVFSPLALSQQLPE